MGHEALFELHRKDRLLLVRIGGSWTALTLPHSVQRLLPFSVEEFDGIHLDCQGLIALDTAGAWAILRLLKQFYQQQKPVTIKGLTATHQAFLTHVQQYECAQPPVFPRRFFLWRFLEHIGRQVSLVVQHSHQLLYFIGELVVSIGHICMHPLRLRLRAIVYHVEKVGLDALPIVGLISFLIGIVLVYQGAAQLKRFGAEIFTVDLLAVSVLREIGILLTAIVVAGRSGSAFTAQIGFMKLNQEIDALWVLGLSAFEVLIIPRFFALVIALPLLAFYADVMALLGGGIMCFNLIDLGFDQFLHHLHLAIEPWTFWTGMIKAPIFAMVISVIGCFEGMQVRGGAENVGTQTTRSVVESIFLVIVMDAAFSILYSYLGI
jgi:phospholipid/cholesterol/gamma-HCH transport system permease protein